MCDWLACWRLFCPTDSWQKDRDESEIWRECGAESMMAVMRGLVSVSLLMLLIMLSQESFREILAFFFEINRLGRVFEQIADGFFRALLHLLLEFPRQDFGVFTR